MQEIFEGYINIYVSMYVRGTRTTLITAVRTSKKCADAAEMRKFRKAPTSLQTQIVHNAQRSSLDKEVPQGNECLAPRHRCITVWCGCDILLILRKCLAGSFPVY